jgi:hypothetical protein
MTAPTLPQKPFIRGVIVISVLAVLIATGYTLLMRNRTEEEEQTPTMAEQVVEVLRSYENRWGSEELALWEEKKEFPLDFVIPFMMYTVPRFEPGQEVMQVGEEQLYTDDFNHRLFVDYPQESAAEGEISAATLEQVFQSLVDDSMTLQKAAQEDWVTLVDTFYNNTEKDYSLRGSTIISAQEQAAKLAVATNTGEKITIWFNNIHPPEMGIEAAKEIALEKMQDIRERLLAGTLTFPQAGDEIKADSVLREIDPSIDANAYGIYSVKGTMEAFHDPEIFASIQALSVDEISNILTGREEDSETNEWQDVFYMVTRVTNRSEGTDSFGAWLEGLRGEYDITCNSGSEG